MQTIRRTALGAVLLVIVTSCSTFAYQSAPGQRIATGTSASYSASNASFSIVDPGDHGVELIVTPNGGASWDIGLAPPSGQTLHTGVYGGAIVAYSATQPHMLIVLYTTPPQQCIGSETGSFTITALTKSSRGIFTHLAGSATSYCLGDIFQPLTIQFDVSQPG